MLTRGEYDAAKSRAASVIQESGISSFEKMERFLHYGMKKFVYYVLHP